jgi:hypothetical protein
MSDGKIVSTLIIVWTGYPINTDHDYYHYASTRVALTPFIRLIREQIWTRHEATILWKKLRWIISSKTVYKTRDEKLCRLGRPTGNCDLYPMHEGYIIMMFISNAANTVTWHGKSCKSIQYCTMQFCIWYRYDSAEPSAGLIASGALAVLGSRAYGVKLEVRPANILYYFVFLRCLSNVKFSLVESHFDCQVVRH